MLRVDTILTGLAGSPMYSRLHFTGTTIEAAQEASLAVAVFWEDLFEGVNPLVGRLTADVQDEVILVEEPSGTPIGVFDVPRSPVSSGSSTIAVVPNASQVLLRLDTGQFRGGRRVRGKMFIPATRASGADADGNVASTTAAILNTAAEGLIAAGLAVYSRPTSGRAGTLFTVEDTDVWSEYAVMRSRRD